MIGLPSHIICKAGQAAKAAGVPRATLYRWENEPQPESRRPRRPRGRRWTSELAQAVEDLRNDKPMWGKRKIAMLLRREGFACPVSTAGRILAHLVKRGAVVPVPLLRRRPAAKRIRLTAKERYARRLLPKGRKAKSPGELVQIDTLFVNIRPDKPVKHFTACDPVAKWTAGRVCTQASASSAKPLLDKLLIEAPFPVRGIQAGGGSEFKSVFEAECQARGLELFVLPPKRLGLNGCVERAQSTWRYEFYATYDLPARSDKLQASVDAFAHRFNHHRPHDALGGQTPAESLQTLGQGDPPPSHMC